ncbi:MAG: HTH domain-containing protein [Bacteroidales bacterium]|nr:HTH domain-containing protein [Bacteroidales bacterium]
MKSLSENLERIRRIDHLIQTKATGAPVDLAKKLGVSERTVYELIKFIKHEMSAPVKYSRIQRTYYFEREGKLICGWNEM